MTVIGRYAVFTYGHKDALLGRIAGLRMRGGAGGVSEKEHHLEQNFS